MALVPLATEADLLNRWADAAGELEVALEVASAAVREAAGVVISETTSTVSGSNFYDAFLPLPGPITAVSEVTLGGVATADYYIEDGGLRLPLGCAGRTVSVTFTHGLPEVPADIVDLTCNLAIAWLKHAAEGGGSTAGLTSARLDDAAEGYSAEFAGQVSPAFIPEVTRAWLARRFGGGAYVVSAR